MSQLLVLRNLMQGEKHTRHTVARGYQVSLPTADRWLKGLEKTIPGVQRTRDGGNTSWFTYANPLERYIKALTP